MILSTLPEEALAAHPFALVQVARLADRTVDFELRLALLEQALALLGDGPCGARPRRSSSPRAP